MFNRLGLSLPLLFVLASVPAQGYPAFDNRRIIAGEIAEDGSIIAGRGFSVRHVSRGVYEVKFPPEAFSLGCPVMTVTTVVAGTVDQTLGTIYQKIPCTKHFRVSFIVPDTHVFQDTTFDFIAVEAE